MTKRIHNFNPGPAALPLEVLEEVQSELIDFKGTGMSILEISHRAKEFEAVLNDAIVRVKRMLKLGDDYTVLFLQGGASSQFYQIPMNLLGEGDTADYLNTGTWSTNAIKEAKKLKKKVNVAASSEDRNFCYIPKAFNFTPGAKYVHITSNNTIKGTQWASFPDTKGVPLVGDMSSDILSRPFDATPFGLIYAGAQKNLGPAGVCMVIIRKDLLEQSSDDLPSMISYKVMAENNSLYNTPPCFSIYVLQLVMKWLEEKMGGLDAMYKVNQTKSSMLYNLMDASNGFYKPTADLDSRSMMNITFRLASEELEKKFLVEAKAADLGDVKGHRSVGGCRASIYNAVPLASVTALADFMTTFAKKNG